MHKGTHLSMAIVFNAINLVIKLQIIEAFNVIIARYLVIRKIIIRITIQLEKIRYITTFMDFVILAVVMLIKIINVDI